MANLHAKLHSKIAYYVKPNIALIALKTTLRIVNRVLRHSAISAFNCHLRITIVIIATILLMNRS